MFKSFTHFQLTLVYGVGWRSSFIVFAGSCPVLPAPLIEETIFTPFEALFPFVKILEKF